MELIAGLCIIVFGLFMIFILNLFSQAFSKEIMIGDKEIVQGYLNADNLIFPIIIIIIGIILVIMYYTKQKKL